MRTGSLMSDSQRIEAKITLKPESLSAFGPSSFSLVEIIDVKCIQDARERACDYWLNGPSAGGIFALIGGDQPKVPHPVESRRHRTEELE